MYFYANSSQSLFDGCSGDITTLAFLVCPFHESNVLQGLGKTLREGVLDVCRKELSAHIGTLSVGQI